MHSIVVSQSYILQSGPLDISNINLTPYIGLGEGRLVTFSCYYTGIIFLKKLKFSLKKDKFQDDDHI